MPDAGDGKELMSAAELKPLLMQSKRKPVSCVIGMTKDKQGVLLLDKKVKPRKLLAEAKTRARSAGLELDLVSLRFGRASVDAADSGTVQFVVNKDAPGALRPKLVEKLRPAGIRKCEIGVDAALENESEDDEPGAAPDSGDGTGRPGAGAEPGAGAAASTGPAGGAAGTAGTPPESQGAAAGPQDTDGDTPAPGSPALGAAPDGVPRDGDGAAGPRPDRGNGRAASDKAAVTRRLSGLVSRMAEALPGRPPGAQAMRAAADKASRPCMPAMSQGPARPRTRWNSFWAGQRAKAERPTADPQMQPVLDRMATRLSRKPAQYATAARPEPGLPRRRPPATERARPGLLAQQAPGSPPRPALCSRRAARPGPPPAPRWRRTCRPWSPRQPRTTARTARRRRPSGTDSSRSSTVSTTG